MKELDKIQKLIDTGTIKKTERLSELKRKLENAKLNFEKYERLADNALADANETGYLEANEQKRRAEDSIHFYETVIKDVNSIPVIDNPEDIASSIVEIRRGIYEDMLSIAAHDLFNLYQKFNTYYNQIARCDALEKAAIDCTDIKEKALELSDNMRINGLFNTINGLKTSSLKDYWPSK